MKEEVALLLFSSYRPRGLVILTPRGVAGAGLVIRVGAGVVVRPAFREDNLAMSSSAVKAAFLSLALIAVRSLVFAVSNAVMSVADQIRPVRMGFQAEPMSDAARLALFQSPPFTYFLVLSMEPRMSVPAGAVGVGVLGRVGAGLVNLVGRGAVGFCLVPTLGHAAPPRINAKTIKSAVTNSEILQPLRYRSTCVHLL